MTAVRTADRGRTALGGRLADAIALAEQDEEHLVAELLRVRQELSRLRLAQDGLGRPRRSTADERQANQAAGGLPAPGTWASELHDEDVEAAMESDPYEHWTVETLHGLLPGSSEAQIRRRLRRLARDQRVTISRPPQAGGGNGPNHYVLVPTRTRRTRTAPPAPIARTLRERILVLLAQQPERGFTFDDIADRLDALDRSYLRIVLGKMIDTNEVYLDRGLHYRLGEVTGPVAVFVVNRTATVPAESRLETHR